MKDDEINIAIAKACGWRIHDDETARRLGWLYENPKGKLKDKLPDYANDLNAMHEAEVIMTRTQWLAYGRRLAGESTTFRADGRDCAMMTDAFFIAVYASAKRRAEAFLRTLGKWKEPG